MNFSAFILHLSSFVLKRSILLASTREIRRRIKSVKNISQVTKAMEAVSAAKMRKAQMSALAGRPYATLMNSVLAEVVGGAGDFQHPLMEKREVQSTKKRKKRSLYILNESKKCLITTL